MCESSRWSTATAGSGTYWRGCRTTSTPLGAAMIYDTFAQAERAFGEVLGRGPFDPVRRRCTRISSSSSMARNPGVPGHRSRGRGVTLLTVGHDREDAGALRLRVDGDRLTVRTESGDESIGTADRLALADAVICAPIGPTAAAGSACGVGSGAAMVRRVGHRRPGWYRRGRRTVDRDRPGCRSGPTPRAGSSNSTSRRRSRADRGPHGLCVGATGSGKSVLYLCDIIAA